MQISNGRITFFGCAISNAKLKTFDDGTVEISNWFTAVIVCKDGRNDKNVLSLLNRTHKII